MHMDLETKDISNYDYMHCTTVVSLEMSGEPEKNTQKCASLTYQSLIMLNQALRLYFVGQTKWLSK